MTLSPPFTWAMVVLAAAVLGLLAVVGGREQRPELWLRVASYVLLLLALAGFGRWVTVSRADRSATTLIVAVDRSLSMSTGDVAEGGRLISRAAAAERNWLNRPNLDRLQQGLLLEGRTLGDDARRPIVLPDSSVRDGREPRGLESLLTSDLIRLIDSASALGSRDILVLSDGMDTSGRALESAAVIARALGVRVHTVALGEAVQGEDTAVVLSAMSERLVAGESTSLVAQVHGPEDAPPARLTVRERRYADRAAGGMPMERVIFERIVSYGGERQGRLEIPIRPTAQREEGATGAVELFEYRAELDPMPGEERTANNTARAVVRLTDAPIRVLVVEGEPHWDTRFLMAALRLDEDIELVAAQSIGTRRLLVRWSEAGRGAGAGGDGGAVQLASETRMRELIDEADIVVLGRGVDRLLSVEDGERLREFVVERGGGLVMLRGRPTPEPSLAPVFDQLAPVDWADRAGIARSRAALTEAGQRSGLFEARDLPEGEFRTEFDTDTRTIVAALPDLATVTRVERERSLSVVLLRSEEDASALIAHARTGSGRVLAVLGEGLWRWAIRPPDAFASADAEAVYSALWRRMTRWLVGREAFLPGEELSVRVLPRMVRPGEAARVEVRARSGETGEERSPRARLVFPDGGSRELAVRSATDEPSARVGFGERAWGAVIEADEPGVYRVVASWEDEAEGAGGGRGIDLLVVQEDRGELRDVATRRAEMDALSGATGGLALPVRPEPEDLDRLLETIVAGVEGPEADPVRRFEPVWDSPWLFIGLVFFLILAWWLNRRWGDA